LESESKKPIPSNINANQFISVHSNIVHNDTVTLNSKYADVLPTDYLACLNESLVFMDFMMVVNNCYTSKIYDLRNSEIKDICIQFRDVYGKLIPIRTSYSSGDPIIADEIQQATFKIETELAILE
jgi:hypothetical protein